VPVRRAAADSQCEGCGGIKWLLIRAARVKSIDDTIVANWHGSIPGTIGEGEMLGVFANMRRITGGEIAASGARSAVADAFDRAATLPVDADNARWFLRQEVNLPVYVFPWIRGSSDLSRGTLVAAGIEDFTVADALGYKHIFRYTQIDSIHAAYHNYIVYLKRER
jgi:hypothetical protein